MERMEAQEFICDLPMFELQTAHSEGRDFYKNVK
jgi:hypothetical protein